MTNIKRRSKTARDSVSNHRGEALNQKIAQCDLTPQQRDYLVRSVIGSQAIEGIDVSREEAEEWLDEVLERRSLKMHLD